MNPETSPRPTTGYAEPASSIETAREEANEASKDLAILSICAFVAFVLGAAASTLGSRHGAETARRCESRVVVA
jgi:hypothetical protein